MSNNQIALLQKDITDEVSGKLNGLQDKGLKLPGNYNAQNALKSAFFELKNVKDRSNRPALDVCTRESIANTLLNMVTQGLSPAKTQCYFIVYGDQLQMQRSYFGTQTVLKRLSGVKDIWANVIYDGDEFDIEIDEKGRERLKLHKTSFFNKDNPIIGAYAIIDTEHDGQMLTAMTKKQIDVSWSQAKTKNVHNKFPEEMAKRTVINRAAKNYINTSNDSDTLVQAINETTENEYDPEVRRKDVTETGGAEDKSKLLAERFKEKQAKQIEAKEEPVETTEKEPEPEDDNIVDADYEEVEDNSEEPEEESTEEAPEKEKEVDLNNYTVAQIKAALDNYGVPYDSDARKPELIKIADEFLNGGEDVAEQTSLI